MRKLEKSLLPLTTLGVRSAAVLFPTDFRIFSLPFLEYSICARFARESSQDNHNKGERIVRRDPLINGAEIGTAGNIDHNEERERNKIKRSTRQIRQIKSRYIYIYIYIYFSKILRNCENEETHRERKEPILPSPPQQAIGREGREEKWRKKVFSSINRREG